MMVREWIVNLIDWIMVEEELQIVVDYRKYIGKCKWIVEGKLQKQRREWRVVDWDKM